MEVAACEISRLPEELLAAALSLTTPLDACRSAAASVAFRAAADSDAVWARFLPRDLPPLADGELSPPPASKKELFLRLSDRPVLLADGVMSMWLERETGAKCYMLSARALQIVWGDTPEHWRWVPLLDSSHRFSEVAELMDVCWLEISSKIESKMLSCRSSYAAYLVFKLSHRCYGLTSPHQLTSVTIGGSESKHQIRLQDDEDADDDDDSEYDYGDTDGEDVDADDDDYSEDADTKEEDMNADVGADSEDVDADDNEDVDADGEDVDANVDADMGGDEEDADSLDGQTPAGDDVLLPCARSDGWMEVEMGEFYNEEGDDGKVFIRLREIRAGNWKKGLIVQGIEIRPKK